MRIMKKLLKNPTFLLASSRSGGHGWARPDPPVPEVYVHKRELSIYDANLWFYDNTAPEYMVSLYEQHLNDHYGALKEMLRIWPYVWGVYIVVGSYCFLFYNSWHESVDPETIDDGTYFRDLAKTNDKRGAMKKNFLGLNLNGENGGFFADYDERTFLKGRVESWKDQARQVNAANQEAKNYVEKVEKEIRAKYAAH